ncbi:DgyrCDS6495 [Dimorphilus gyrociliatus]|uniref:DgyrCDS6495 n=1 Tax=Dimorphilus gyrociliatus TaxID=2664684 RepID=A0A7I8VN84_9ANNE|nr:DgyrCDS6495 [Dimorphilus gyrociliatus]
MGFRMLLVFLMIVALTKVNSAPTEDTTATPDVVGSGSGGSGSEGSGGVFGNEANEGGDNGNEAAEQPTK